MPDQKFTPYFTAYCPRDVEDESSSLDEVVNQARGFLCDQNEIMVVYECIPRVVVKRGAITQQTLTVRPRKAAQKTKRRK